MTDFEKLDQDIAAAQSTLERAASDLAGAPETQSSLHMLRLALGDLKTRRDQPRRRVRAA